MSNPAGDVWAQLGAVPVKQTVAPPTTSTATPSSAPDIWDQLGAKPVSTPTPSGPKNELPAFSQITGISAQPKPTGIADKISTWSEHVMDDIKHGTDITGIGTVLQKMGAHGVYSGEPEAVGNYMASLPLGILRATKGTAEAAQPGHRLQGAGDIVGGAGQVLTGQVGGFLGAGPSEAGSTAVSKAGNLIPSAERAGKVMAGLREAIGTHPVEMTDDLSKAVSRAQELADNGNTMSAAVRKFVNRVTDPEKGHLTYNEARDFMTKFGSMTADESAKIAPVMKQAITKIGMELKDAVSQTAERAGKLEQFQGSMREYRNAKTLQDVLDWAKDFSVKGIAQKAGVAGALVELKKLID